MYFYRNFKSIQRKSMLWSELMDTWKCCCECSLCFFILLACLFVCLSVCLLYLFRILVFFSLNFSRIHFNFKWSFFAFTQPTLILNQSIWFAQLDWFGGWYTSKIMHTILATDWNWINCQSTIPVCVCALVTVAMQTIDK